MTKATHDYLECRLEQIRYQSFVTKGYPIGSGSVESANKLVVEARLKGSGMHWSRETVNPMLALRTILANGRWNEDWPRVWMAWREHARTQATARRQRRQTALTPVSARHEAPPADPSPPPAPVDAPPPAPCAKTVVNGTPTPDHIWRKTSPFPAKS